MSYRIRRLLVISIAIIILAISANKGTVYIPTKTEVVPAVYPYIPEISNDIVDQNIGVVPVKAAAPKPIATTPPVVSAEAYLVKNLVTGQVYSSYNIRKVFPIASLTKIITAIVAMENMPADKKVLITKEILDSGYGEAGNLKEGDIFTVSELLYPLLLVSSNDAAEALAVSYGYSVFIAKMNAFASGLGMSATSFRDASGISSGNISNASDLFLLAQYLYLKDKPLLALTRTKTMTLASTTEHAAHTFNTINPFPFDPNFLGGKTGRTNEAKESMISLFRYTQGETSYPIAVIVLRSDFKIREIDSSMLFIQFLKKIGQY